MFYHQNVYIFFLFSQSFFPCLSGEDGANRVSELFGEDQILQQVEPSRTLLDS